jgi:hypothetical protein
MSDAHEKTKPETPSLTPKSPEEDAGERTAREIGGPKGPEPTRYGDWERAGRCIDF